MCSLFNLKLIILFAINFNNVLLSQREDNSHWQSLGTSDIEQALKLENIDGVARNVILFVGDGMGLTTATAARIYSKTEAGFLAFEKFPHIGALKTYNADKLVPDSCSTATALFCGIKSNLKTTGVPPSVEMDDCNASLAESARIDSIFSWAQREAKSTGFVTTTRVTHATPSALYAHSPNRDWECEARLPAHALQCKDIARQLVEDAPGRNINVIMGGGRQMLVSNVEGNSSDPIDTWSCFSSDGRDLLTDWQRFQASEKRNYALVQNSGELDRLDTAGKDYVLGVFANGHLKMEHERDKSPGGMPSLRDMTAKALEILAKNKRGYVLMVEGGMIDFGHHRGHARKALDETVAFSDAVQVALDMTDARETLIIVTSDHSHSMTFSGYPSRTSSVLDVAQKSKIDGVAYTSLLYTTGGENNYKFSVDANGKVTRADPTGEDTRDFEYSQQGAVLTDEVTHSGTDVLVYAYGPMAHLFHSVHEQTHVAYVISYAAKIGPLKNLNNGGQHRVNYSVYLGVAVLVFQLLRIL